MAIYTNSLDCASCCISLKGLMRKKNSTKTCFSSSASGKSCSLSANAQTMASQFLSTRTRVSCIVALQWCAGLFLNLSRKPQRCLEPSSSFCLRVPDLLTFSTTFWTLSKIAQASGFFDLEWSTLAPNLSVRTKLRMWAGYHAWRDFMKLVINALTSEPPSPVWWGYLHWYQCLIHLEWLGSKDKGACLHWLLLAPGRWEHIHAWQYSYLSFFLGRSSLRGRPKTSGCWLYFSKDQHSEKGMASCMLPWQSQSHP